MSMHRLTILWCVCLFFVSGCAQNRYRHSSPERYLEEANKALRNKKCWEAQKLFRNLLSDFPGSHLVDDAQYGLGQAYYCDKDYVTAIFEYERLLNEFPTSPFVDEARYQIGMCYYEQSRDIHHDQDETEKAIREFRRFIEDFPHSDLIPGTEKRIQELRDKLAAKKLMIAENYMQWKSYISAERYCEIILDEYSDTNIVGRAQLLLARARHKLGKLEEALEALTLLAADNASEALKRDAQEEIRRVRESMAQRADTQAPADGK